MVAVPHEGSWSFRVLGSRDRERLLAFLDSEPILNIFFISKILDEGVGTVSPMVEVVLDGSTVCVASVGSNVVLACDPYVSESVRATALALLAEKILAHYLPVRAIIADHRLVEELWSRLRTRIDAPTVVRLSQPVYAIPWSRRDYPALMSMRFATLRDLDQLVPACAAMHREEVGIDPMDRDAVAYRKRVRELIVNQRALVRIVDGQIAFKCEFSGVTSRAIQLMGVWTAPAFRGQGMAREGLAEVCGWVLEQKKSVTLFVNDFNTPAIQLYESLGFERIGCNRALIW